MDRQLLDSLYVGSRGLPRRVFMRAAAEDPLEASTHDFFLDHIEELGVDVLVSIFNARPALDLEIAEKPFVRRLAQLAASIDLSQLLEAPVEVDDVTLPGSFRRELRVSISAACASASAAARTDFSAPSRSRAIRSCPRDSGTPR